MKALLVELILATSWGPEPQAQSKCEGPFSNVRRRFVQLRKSLDMQAATSPMYSATATGV